MTKWLKIKTGVSLICTIVLIGLAAYNFKAGEAALAKSYLIFALISASATALYLILGKKLVERSKAAK